MKTKVILIFILAFILRFWQLGTNPPSLDWDEAALGYNAYSILHTGKDEYGTFLPLSFRSFGDYKPPVYTYFTTLPVIIFGLNEFSTRFISALMGTLTVIVSYYLVKEIFAKYSSRLYLIFTLLFAISPWHIQFSRVAFEANTALFFMVTGVWLFLLAIKQRKYFVLSFIAFAFSLYSYHSPRLIIPLLIIGMFILFRKKIGENRRWPFIGLSIFVILSLPIFWQIASSTGARLGSVTILTPENLNSSIKEIQRDEKNGDMLGKLMHNRRIVYAMDALGGYLDHFNFDFLFLTGDPPGRHHATSMGMLYLWDAPFIAIGLYYLLKNRSPYTNVILLWFIIAPIASALTTGTPHAVRALLYLPTYQIFSAIGLVIAIDFLTKLAAPTKIKKGIIMTVAALLICNFFYYLHMYWIHTPAEYSQSWQYGYKQVVDAVSKIENKYDKVIVTYRYDQPYIFFLFYNKVDPSWYQQNWQGDEIKRMERRFGKYEFHNIDWNIDGQRKNVLLVGTPEEIPANTSGMIKELHFLDGSVAFRIVAR